MNSVSNIYRYSDEDDPVYNPFINYELKETFNKLQLNRPKYGGNYDEKMKLWDVNSVYILGNNPYTKIYELMDSINENTEDNVKYITEIVDFVENGFQDVDRIIDMTESFGIKDLSNEPEEIFERYAVFVEDAVEYAKHKDSKNLYSIYMNGDDENRVLNEVYSDRMESE
jgi:hypothetical protein